MFNILIRGQIIQSTVRTDIVIDPFPTFQATIQGLQVALRRKNSVEFIKMRSTGSLNTSTKFWRAGW